MSSHLFLSKQTTLLQCIHNGDDLEFSSLVEQLQLNMNRHRRSKAFAAYKFVKNLPLVCTLYNRYKMIKEIRTMLKDIYSFECNTSFALDIHVKDLAKVLKFTECEDELNQLYTNGDHDKHHVCQNTNIDDFCLYEGVLAATKICSYDYKIISKTLQSLVEYGYNINAQEPSSRRRPFHIAIIQSVPYDVICTMITLEADMNVYDKFGHSPFHLCIQKKDYRSDKMLILKVLKLWLYQNPDVSRHGGILQDAVSSDLQLKENPRASKPADNEQFLLTWLHQAGFRIPENLIYDKPAIVDLASSFNEPRRLKEIARFEIRKTYPGLKLHETLNHARLPTSIKDYILMKELNTT